MKERQLVKDILKGNVSAFEYFVDKYQDMAYTIAYRICNNRQDAEDIVQESFLKVFRNLHTFRQDSKFSTWLYRIVYNTAVSYLREPFHLSQSGYEGLENMKEDWTVFDKIEEEERKEIVNSIITKLPKDDAFLLTLFYLEEVSIKEINLITGFTENNIKVKLHRARKRFMEILLKVRPNINVV